MKKILILLSFLSVFAPASTLEEFETCPVGFVLVLYLDYDPVNNFTTNSSCPVTTYQVSNGSHYMYEKRDCSCTPTGCNYISQSHLYKCVSSIVCPEGQSWDYKTQSCKISCLPYQHLHEVGVQYCEDMCPTLDVYDPPTGNEYVDSIINGLADLVAPYDPLICKTPDTVDEQTCNAHSDEGYHWICPQANGLSILFGYLTGMPMHGDCYCGNEIKSMPPCVPYLGGGKPRTSPKIDTKALPWADYPKLVEKLDGMTDEALEGFEDWVEYMKNKGYENIDGSKPTNYDYTDTRIERDPVTGKETFVPEFTETVPTSGQTTITSDAFTDNILNNPYRSTIDSTLPQTDLAVSPEAYTAGVQTATRTQFNLPETAPAGPLVTTETVPSNLTGGTTTRPYNWDVTTPTTGTTRYTSVNGDTTTTVDSVINTDGTTKYTVTTSTPYTNSDGRSYVNNNTYNYTTSGGTVTYVSSPTSTTTGSTGTYNNNVPTNTIYNYNTSNQNIDELLNFKPTVTDTGMTKPFNEMVKAQSDTLDFIDSLKNSINGIKLDFDAMMLKLQNPPQIHEKTGNCNLTAVFLGKTIVANPCNAFYPYREMLKLFFIAFGSFFVARFAVENLK